MKFNFSLDVAIALTLITVFLFTSGQIYLNGYLGYFLVDPIALNFSVQDKIYLGFFLDPIYKVHWNNLTKPLEFSLKLPAGVNVSPLKGFDPKIKEPADKDPREFLLDINSNYYRQPLVLKVRYFACDDADTFCVPVTQQYSIHLKPDLDRRSMQR